MVCFDYKKSIKLTEGKVNMNSNEQLIKRNVIFYSNNNTSLYNDLKQSCTAEQFSIVLANNLGELDNVIHSTEYSVLFVDANTKKVDKEFIDFISYSDKIVRHLSIIIDGDGNFENVPSTIFSMSSNEVIHKIPDIKRSVKLLENANAQMIAKAAKEVKESDIFEVLLEHGFDMKLEGFKYILNIVRLFLKDEKVASPLCKSAYPIVASAYETKPENVERNIRNAIKQASKTEKFQQGLARLISPNPSNMQVINYFVTSLKTKWL